MFYYTYILKSIRDGQFYTGFTNDLRKPSSHHATGQFISNVDRRPLDLLSYYKAYMDQVDAFAREEYLKTGMGKHYIKNRLKRFLSLTG